MNNFLKIHLILLSFCLACSPKEQIENLPILESIHINQIGFYPDQKKIGIVIKVNSNEVFEIWDIQNKVSVFSSNLIDKSLTNSSGQSVLVADFSELNQLGEFALVIPGKGKSHSFKIDNKVNEKLAKATLKAFYFQRASIDIPVEFGGIWARALGHPDDQVIFHPSAKNGNASSETTKIASNGWYDAGDYNKYIVNSGITTGTLMSLKKDFSEYSDHLKLDIPESSNDVPDLLDEIKWNLDWMLTMQDPEDGGVYHKLTSAKFEGMIRPSEAVSARYFVSKSTAATLDFSAVMAQASRIYKSINPELSVVYLKASEKAWYWAKTNPTLIYDQNVLNSQFEPKIVTGAYGDTELEDEWIWAASELLISTHNLEYWSNLKDSDLSFKLPSWSQVKWLGYYSLLAHEDELRQIPEEWLAMLKINLIGAADEYLYKIKSNPNQVAMGSNLKDFVWGSNSVTANQSILFIKAFLITNNSSYLEAAEGNLDYLLGRNGTGYSFVTGFGSKSPLHPHHRLAASEPDLPPIPGFLVGGPNPGKQDNCDYPSDLPDLSYIDETKSFASNEIAINWNAPLTYVVNALESIHSKNQNLRVN